MQKDNLKKPLLTKETKIDDDLAEGGSKSASGPSKQPYKCFENVGRVFQPYEIDTDFMDKPILVHQQGDNCEDALVELKKRIDQAESNLQEVKDPYKDNVKYDDGVVFDAEEQMTQVFNNQGKYDEFLIKKQNVYLTKLFGDQIDPKQKTTIEGLTEKGCQQCKTQVTWSSSFKVVKCEDKLFLSRTRSIHNVDDESKGRCETHIYQILGTKQSPKKIHTIVHSEIEQLLFQSHSCTKDETIQNGKYLYYFIIQKDAFGDEYSANLMRFNMLACVESEVATFPLAIKKVNWKGTQLDALPFRIQFAVPGHEYDKNMKHFHDKLIGETDFINSLIFVVCFYTPLGGQDLQIESVRTNTNFSKDLITDHIVTGSSVKRHNYCYLKKGETFHGVTLDEDIFIRFITNLKQLSTYGEYYKGDKDGKPHPDKTNRYELYHIKHIKTSSESNSKTPKKSISGAILGMYNEQLEKTYAINDLQFIDYKSDTNSQVSKDLHQVMAKKYNGAMNKDPTLNEGYSYGFNNSTTTYTVDEKGAPYGEHGHCNYEIASIFALLFQWGIVLTEKSINQHEMRIVKDYVLNKLIVVFCYGAAPLLDEPDSQLSRKEILVMSGTLVSNVRQEGIPDDSSLSSMIQMAQKNSIHLRNVVGRAKNVFLQCSSEKKQNVVFLKSDKNNQVKQIQVQSISQETSIEKLFPKNYTFYYDDLEKSLDSFNHSQSDNCGQTYYSWRSRSFFTHRHGSFDAEYTLIKNPDYDPNYLGKDVCKKSLPIIVSFDPKYFVRDLKAFHLMTHQQTYEDMHEKPFVMFDFDLAEQYLVVLDLVKKEVVSAIQVNIQQQGVDQQKSQKLIQDYCDNQKLIQPSSEVYKSVNYVNGKPIDCFCKNYQMAVIKSVQETQFSEIHEYQITWTPSQKKDRQYDITTKIVGITHLIFNLPEMESKYLRLEPKFDEYNRINGTQLKIQLKKEDNLGNKYRIYYFPNDHDYDYQNEFTKTAHFKYMKKKTSKVEMLFVKSVFKDDSEFKTNSFHSQERSELLFQANKSFLNMVPNDQVLFKTKAFDYLQNMEILGGQCQADFYMSDPQTIQDLLNKEKEEGQQHLYYRSLIEQMLEESGKMGKKLQVKFQNLGLLRGQKEPSYDLTFQTILHRCLKDDAPYNLAAESIFQIMLDQDSTLANQKIMMSMFPLVLNLENPDKNYFEFLKFHKQEDSPELEDVKKLSMKTNLTQKKIPKYSEERLQVRTGQLDNFGGSNIHEMCYQEVVDTNVKGNDFEIQNFFIDFRSLILSIKVDNYRSKIASGDTKKPLIDKIDDFFIADLLEKNHDLSGDSISDQLITRTIVDYQYVQTEKFFFIQGMIYLFLYFMPLVVNIFAYDQTLIILCNILCMICTCVYFVVEIIQMKDMGMSYFLDFWNVNDFSKFFMYCFYFGLRVSYPVNQLIIRRRFDPETGEIEVENHTDGDAVSDEDRALMNTLHTDSGYTQMISILNGILVLQAFVKFLFYLRVNEKVGQLISLVIISAQDAMPFMIFMLSWVVLFSLEFQILGLEVDPEEYEGLGWKAIYMLQSYRNSIGDLAAPGTSKWSEAAIDSPNASWMMIYAVWFIWLLNQYLVLIILLNFLIAVISTSYETVMEDELFHKYQARVAFNRECRLLLSAFGLQTTYDMMIVSCEKEENQSDDMSQMAHSIKQFISRELSGVKNQIEKVDKIETKLDKLTELVEKLNESNESKE